MSKSPTKQKVTLFDFVRVTKLQPYRIRKRKRDGKWVLYGLFSNGPAVFEFKHQARHAVRIDRAIAGHFSRQR